MDRHVVLSGCSGGGKSTLIAELARRGFATVPEPGRRVIAEGTLPWIDMAAFARRAMAMAREDRAQAPPGLVFFDRGWVDAAAALDHATGEPALRAIDAERYHPHVFMAPPWPEIFAPDDDRRHDFAAARAEYDRLCRAYANLGYAVTVLPKQPVGARADWLLHRLA
jgi:predicted ATPase